MTGVVVEFGRAWRAEGDWSVEEREAIARLVERLIGDAAGLTLSFGLSDARDPWCAVLDADGEVVLHVARIDGLVILHRTRDDLILRSGAPAALAAIAARPVAGEAAALGPSHERDGPVAPPPPVAASDALSTTPQLRPAGDAPGAVALPGAPRPVGSALPALPAPGAVGQPAAHEFRLEGVAHHDLTFPLAATARPQLAPLLLFPTSAAEASPPAAPGVPLTFAPLALVEAGTSAIILPFPIRAPTTGTVQVAGPGPVPELPPVLGWGDAAAPRVDVRPVMDPHVIGSDPHVTGGDPPPNVPIVGQPLASQAA